MTQPQTRRLTVLALVAALSASLLTAAPAQAATPAQADAICPAGSTCLWRDNNFESWGYIGRFVRFAYYIPAFASYNYPSSAASLSNSVTSFYNNGNTETVYLFSGTYLTGSYMYAPVNSYSNLAGTAFDDKLNSGYYESCLDGVCG